MNTPANKDTWEKHKTEFYKAFRARLEDFRISPDKKTFSFDDLLDALLQSHEQEVRRKVVEEAQALIQMHTEDENRGYCDADGLYCRSDCIYMAVKRLSSLLPHTK